MDRTLTAKGILLQDITPLQRLSYVGLKGMGALLYRPQIETTAQETLQVELDAIAKEMVLVLQGASSLAIDALYKWVVHLEVQDLKYSLAIIRALNT